MKTIYELVFKTTDGEDHNLMFSSKRKANKDLKEIYYEGAGYLNGEIITNSFVISRILF